MGFGYLLIGYLITFVLCLTVNALGLGGLALFTGALLMLYGLWNLNHYHSAFTAAKWLAAILSVAAFYDMLNSFDALFSWNLPLFGMTADNISSWILFLILIIFNIAMLYGIRMIARDLELLQMSASAVRNSFFVALYAILYIIAHMPFPAIESITVYLTLPVVLTNLLWIFLNLILLISCNKNICRAGDEEQPAKPSRIGFLNRMNEIYEKNRQDAIDKTTREAEEALRRRKEARERKKLKHKKKKK